LVLEWYPWSTFSEIEEIGKGGYGTVFRAKTKVGRIWKWDHKENEWSAKTKVGSIIKWNHQSNQWRRYDDDEYVALKTIGHYESLSKDFLNEVTNLCLLYQLYT